MSWGLYSWSAPIPTTFWYKNPKIGKWRRGINLLIFTWWHHLCYQAGKWRWWRKHPDRFSRFLLLQQAERRGGCRSITLCQSHQCNFTLLVTITNTNTNATSLSSSPSHSSATLSFSRRLIHWENILEEGFLASIISGPGRDVKYFEMLWKLDFENKLW